MRRFLHQKYANVAQLYKFQKSIRTYQAKKLRSKLLDQRNEEFLAAREKEKEIIKQRNIQQWDLAANSIVKDIHKGIRMARSPEDSTDDAIQILSRSLKIGRSIRLHQHYDARVVAQIVRCEKVLRQLLYEKMNAKSCKFSMVTINLIIIPRIDVHIWFNTIIHLFLLP